MNKQRNHKACLTFPLHSLPRVLPVDRSELNWFPKKKNAPLPYLARHHKNQPIQHQVKATKLLRRLLWEPFAFKRNLIVFLSTTRYKQPHIYVPTDLLLLPKLPLSNKGRQVVKV
jgi:hypothetical protein